MDFCSTVFQIAAGVLTVILALFWVRKNSEKLNSRGRHL